MDPLDGVILDRDGFRYVIAVRSLVFNLVFYAWTALMLVICLPALAMRRRP